MDEQRTDGISSDDRSFPSITVPIRVRYAECDPMGVLHHAMYFEYFEVSRTALLQTNGFRYRELEREGVLFVVYKIAAKYLKPIRYDDDALVTTFVTRITRTRVDHRYEIHVNHELATVGESTLACVGRDGKPMLMPDSLWGVIGTPEA